jgi:formate dehydrogenase
MLTLLARDEWDVGQLTRLAQVMQDASICGLGQAALNPVLGLLKDFRTTLTHQQIIVSDATASVAEGGAP